MSTQKKFKAIRNFKDILKIDFRKSIFTIKNLGVKFFREVTVDERLLLTKRQGYAQTIPQNTLICLNMVNFNLVVGLLCSSKLYEVMSFHVAIEKWNDISSYSVGAQQDYEVLQRTRTSR